MARLPRAVWPGQAHLLVQRGHSGQPVFIDTDDRLRYLTALRDAALDSGVALHGYGLLDTEVRLLATPSSADGLARLLQTTSRRYVRLFNQRHRRSGSPWEGRFRSAVVEGGDWFVACLRYLESGDATDADEPFPAARSSARHHLGLAGSPLLREHPAYWALGNTPFEREAAYRRLLERPLPPPQLAGILQALRSGWVIGSPSFAAAAAEHTGRRTVPRRPGRPRAAEAVMTR